MRLGVLVCLMCGCAEERLVAPTGAIDWYDVTELTLPSSQNEARELGIDLDDDHEFDNQLGMIASTLGGYGAEPGYATMALLDTNKLVDSVAIQHAAASEPDDVLALAIIVGADRPATLADPLLGRIADGRVLVGPGALTVAIGFFDDVVELQLIGARVRLDHVDAAQLTGAIGGGVRQSRCSGSGAICARSIAFCRVNIA